jgi:hypothetical protein
MIFAGAFANAIGCEIGCLVTRSSPSGYLSRQETEAGSICCGQGPADQHEWQRLPHRPHYGATALSRADRTKFPRYCVPRAGCKSTQAIWRSVQRNKLASDHDKEYVAIENRCYQRTREARREADQRAPDPTIWRRTGPRPTECDGVGSSRITAFRSLSPGKTDQCTLSR